VRLRNRDIIWTTLDWEGREVILDRQTLKSHILRYHHDMAFLVDTIKSGLAKPRVVIENKKHKSDNAIYDFGFGGFPWTLVSVKYGWLKKRQVSTIYGIEKGYQPKGKILWPKK